MPFPILSFLWVSVNSSVLLAHDTSVALRSRPQELKPTCFNKNVNIDIARSFVKTMQFNPTAQNDIKLLELTKELCENELYDVVLDATLAPNIRTSNEYKPTIKQIGWAPLNFHSKFRSLLTTLNDSGSLDIFIHENEWIHSLSISKEWIKKCRQLWQNDNPSNIPQDILRDLKKRTYNLKITAFCWGGLCTTNCKSLYLFTATKCGTLAVWNVIRDPNVHGIQLSFINCLTTNTGDITALEKTDLGQNRYLIYFSNHDGQIYSIIIELTGNTVTFGSPLELWKDKDRIQVNPGGLVSYQSSSKFNVLIAAKGMFIIIFIINSDGLLVTLEVLQSGDIATTGIQFISECQILTVTTNGTFSLITINLVNEELTINADKIECSFKGEGYSVLGLAFSANKIISYIPLSVQGYYDPMYLKEPSQGHLCTISDLLKPTEVLEAFKFPFYKMWDALEVLRIQCLKKTSQLTILSASEYDSMNSDNLKKNLWFAQAVLMSETQDGIENLSLREIKDTIVNLIKCRHAVQRASFLLKTSRLKGFELYSLGCTKAWISQMLGKLDFTFKTTKAELTEIKKLIDGCGIHSPKEICTICEDSIPNFTGHINAVCSAGHTMPRCSISFVLCTDFPYYTCSSCNLVAHPKAVSEDFCQCPLCGNFLRMDNLFLPDV